MVKLWCSAFDRYAFRRVGRLTTTDAFQTGDDGRAGVQLPSEAGTPDMTIARAEADRAGARPYLHTQKRSLVTAEFGLSENVAVV
jgi:hypothetical protein